MQEHIDTKSKTSLRVVINSLWVFPIPPLLSLDNCPAVQVRFQIIVRALSTEAVLPNHAPSGVPVTLTSNSTAIMFGILSLP